jgi:hypothetical protein
MRNTLSVVILVSVVLRKELEVLAMQFFTVDGVTVLISEQLRQSQ